MMGSSMKVVKKFIILLSCLLLSTAGNCIFLSLQKCYGEYGCFSIGPPFWSFIRPVNLFPLPPQLINVQLHLFTRRNLDVSQLLQVNNVSGIYQTNFDLSKPSKIIIHGFLDSGITTTNTEIKNELLINDDYNVIIVDWRNGATLPYTLAVANARLVGAIIARFLQLLQKETLKWGTKHPLQLQGNESDMSCRRKSSSWPILALKEFRICHILGSCHWRGMVGYVNDVIYQMTYDYPPSLSHVIGRSLGGQVAGYVGERLNKLGRISALDPAGPYFLNTDPIVRLDPTDATLVDVLHTNAGSILEGGIGIDMPVGHMDFYPNGGSHQPGCEFLDLGIEWFGCSHGRADHYFTESINNCSFQSYKCDNYDNFLNGQCNTCGTNGNYCANMGFQANDYLNNNAITVPIKFYLKTNSVPPFCLASN